MDICSAFSAWVRPKYNHVQDLPRIYSESLLRSSSALEGELMGESALWQQKHLLQHSTVNPCLWIHWLEPTNLPASFQVLCLRLLGKAILIIFLHLDLKNVVTGNHEKHLQIQGTLAQNHDAVDPPVWLPPEVSPQPLIGHSGSEEEQALRADSPSGIGSDLPLDPFPDDTVGDSDPVSPNEDLKLCTEQMMQMAKLLEIETSSNPKTLGQDLRQVCSYLA